MTAIAQSAWQQLIKEGMTVVDATCGNGNDAKWLAERIGPQGQLFALDIQEDAIRSTKAVLEDEVDPQRLPHVRFIHGCHSTLKEHVQAAHLVCFNLGFLPGGDREVISRPDTTVAAIKAAMSILEPRGVISILAYVGHPGGIEEYQAVQEVAKQVNPQEFSALEQRILNRPNAPVLIMLWRRP
ncbi:Putative rRNA methylase YtqB [Coccomyxa sp. Obi]|nr:Putative rRNA methylase YtqB [Coccomyxa sp. Obi]